MPTSVPVIGVVDLGSNTIKLTVARPGQGGGIEELATAAETVRLGAGLAASGRLADDRIAAALATLSDFAARAHEHGASRLIGVATEATRRASNGNAFLQRVHDETGWEIRIISGDEEAALTFNGLAAEVDLSGGVVVADIGGGSTEIIRAEDGTIASALSIQLGSGGLTDAHVVADPPTRAEIATCIASATDALAALSLASRAGARLIVAGGTGAYMSRLAAGAPVLNADQVEATLRRCQERPAADLAATLGIAPARARVLPAGIAIVRALTEAIQPDQIEVSRSGVRTALLLEAFAAHP